MTDVLPPRDDDEPIDHHRANYVYPPRPLPGPEPEPALAWRPHPAIMARAPPFPFLRKAGPIPGSFWAVPGLLMVGPDPRWERRGALERLEFKFRIAEVVSDDVVVQARNLAPHLIEGPPIYVCGRGARAFAAYPARIDERSRAGRHQGADRGFAKTRVEVTGCVRGVGQEASARDDGSGNKARHSDARSYANADPRCPSSVALSGGNGSCEAKRRPSHQRWSEDSRGTESGEGNGKQRAHTTRPLH